MIQVYSLCSSARQSEVRNVEEVGGRKILAQFDEHCDLLLLVEP